MAHPMEGVLNMCGTCGRTSVLEFRPEVWTHLAGPDGETVDLPVYPVLTVCLECGISTFRMPPTEMQLLREAVRRDFELLRTTTVADLFATM